MSNHQGSVEGHTAGPVLITSAIISGAYSVYFAGYIVYKLATTGGLWIDATDAHWASAATVVNLLIWTISGVICCAAALSKATPNE